MKKTRYEKRREQNKKLLKATKCVYMCLVLGTIFLMLYTLYNLAQDTYIWQNYAHEIATVTSSYSGETIVTRENGSTRTIKNSTDTYIVGKELSVYVDKNNIQSVYITTSLFEYGILCTTFIIFLALCLYIRRLIYAEFC